MEEKINSLHRRQNRTRIAIFAIVGFLSLLTYLLISVSQELATETITTGSRASDALFARVSELNQQDMISQERQNENNENIDPKSCTQGTPGLSGFSAVEQQGRIVGCKASVYCGDYNGSFVGSPVECSYNPANPRESNPSNFNANSCDRAGCMSQAAQLCGCPAEIPEPTEPPVTEPVTQEPACTAVWAGTGNGASNCTQFGTDTQVKSRTVTCTRNGSSFLKTVTCGSGSSCCALSSFTQSMADAACGC